MLETRLLRERLDWVREKMKQRGAVLNFEIFQDLDEKRRSILSNSESLRHQRNTVSDQIAESEKEETERRRTYRSNAGSFPAD